MLEIVVMKGGGGGGETLWFVCVCVTERVGESGSTVL